MRRKVLLQVLSGRSDANIRFDELRSLLEVLGFMGRVRGGHHIYTRQDLDEIVNLQPKGSMAKPYQVKQVRNIIVRYKLGGEIE